MLIYGNTPRDIMDKIQSKLNGKGGMKKILTFQDCESVFN